MNTYIKRSISAHQRADSMRERVRDAVKLCGVGDLEYGLSQLARRAEAVSMREGLRFFKDGKTTPVAGAINSLNNLLQLRPDATGYSEHWVLDIWETTLADVFETRAEREARATAEGTIDPPETEEELGVRVFNDGAAARPLSLRVLDAFAERDADTMLELALEIERLEKSRA